MASNSTKNNVDVPNLLQTMAWNRLRQGSRATLQPFQITLLDDRHVLSCEEIVRVMPGKRLVAFGTWNNLPVVAKLFYSRKAALHAKREYEGIRALHKADILSPKLYFSGRSKDKKVHVLILERIMGGYSLDEIWQAKPTLQDVTPLMHALTVELATQHVMGILQNDLHFKNFIIKSRQVYTIDAGDLKVSDTPLSKKDSIENIGLYFSQLGVGKEEFCKSLFETYVKARSWLVRKGDIAQLEAAIKRWTTKRVEQYGKKVLRSSTAFMRKNSFAEVVLLDRQYETADFMHVLKNPDYEMQAPFGKILKAGRSSTVAEIKADGKSFVVKRYNIKSVSHWLRRCLRPTRAIKGWGLAHKLRLLDIATAKPVACIERRMLGLRHTSYLFMEKVNGVDLGRFFQENDPSHGIGYDVAQQVVAIIQNLAKLNITHGDLKMTNILVENNHPVLIDLDGMREHTTPISFQHAYKKEIKRFMQNWEYLPDVSQVFSELFSSEVTSEEEFEIA